MWFMVIEVVAAIIATIRGWGWRPIALLGGSLLLGVFLGSTTGTSSMGMMQIIDIGVTITLVVMAIIGKKKPDKEMITLNATPESADRIKCPQCAELIMAEAKVCRYCGYKFVEEEPLQEK